MPRRPGLKILLLASALLLSSCLRDAPACPACRRSMHEHSKVTAIVDGKSATYCCPGCALSEAKQHGKRLKVLTLTDHPTGLPVNAAQAFLVKGSDVNPCRDHLARLDTNKNPMPVVYDRCDPSLLAFASRAGAAEFSRKHGGTIIAAPSLLPLN